MHPGVLDMLRNYLGRPDREGRNRSMYRDTGGATVGIGCQLETSDEWRRVSQGGDGRTGPEAIVLPGPAIRDLFDRQANGNERILRGVFPQWDSYPADAQLGMLHHSWNKGSARGIEAEEGGRYAAAVRARQWEEAGWLSLWPALREARRERHVSRRNDVMRMFRNAALVDATHGAVPVRMLFFPRDAQPSTDRYLHPSETGLGV